MAETQTENLTKESKQKNIDDYISEDSFSEQRWWVERWPQDNLKAYNYIYRKFSLESSPTLVFKCWLNIIY